MVAPAAFRSGSACGGSRVEIVSGLSAGDRVIPPRSGIADGDKVRSRHRRVVEAEL